MHGTGRAGGGGAHPAGPRCSVTGAAACPASWAPRGPAPQRGVPGSSRQPRARRARPLACRGAHAAGCGQRLHLLDAVVVAVVIEDGRILSQGRRVQLGHLQATERWPWRRRAGVVAAARPRRPPNTVWRGAPALAGPTTGPRGPPHLLVRLLSGRLAGDLLLHVVLGVFLVILVPKHAALLGGGLARRGPGAGRRPHLQTVFHALLADQHGGGVGVAGGRGRHGPLMCQCGESAWHATTAADPAATPRRTSCACREVCRSSLPGPCVGQPGIPDRPRSQARRHSLAARRAAHNAARLARTQGRSYLERVMVRGALQVRKRCDRPALRPRETRILATLPHPADAPPATARTTPGSQISGRQAWPRS